MCIYDTVKEKKEILIGNRRASLSTATLIIAEIGMNHNGSIENAFKLIDQSKDAGADIVKFQLRHMDQIYSAKSIKENNSDLSTQYTLDNLKKFQLSNDDYKKIFNYCTQIDLDWICTPWDKKSVDLLEELNCPAYKIASADFTNIDLIDYVLKTKKDLILSTGMSTEDEIKMVINHLKESENNFAVLHCNSTYPTPFKDINLNYLNTFSKLNVLFGYSGHERGIAVSIAAVAMGAKIIERHITLDRNMEGTDHAASLEVQEFTEMVKGIREVELALGEDTPRKITQGEMINRDNISKSIYLKKDFKKGDIFSVNDFEIKSPGIGLRPYHIKSFVGAKAKKDYNTGDCLFETDLKGIDIKKQSFNFNVKWGIPVRPRDFVPMIKNTNPDLIEFHFSYKDLNIPVNSYLEGTYDYEFIIHVPELFADEHLLDLCTADNSYRQISIDHMKRIVELAYKLKPYFPKSKKPQIVIHCGGFTMDHHLKINERPPFYDRLAHALQEIDDDGIELLPENMAPFPWHFGGQRFQNIFVDYNEIKEFCDTYNYRICQDISHSFLTCNYFKWDHLEYTKTLAPYSIHYHISDGEGVDGEGLQILDGNIDFPNIGNIIKQYSPNSSSFIPEIWQGHKNNGEGFWNGLNTLQDFL